MHTSYAWIRSNGSEPDWGHVDADQFGLSPYYRLYRCRGDGWVFLAAITDEEKAKLSSVVPGSPAAEDAEGVASWLSAHFEGVAATKAFQSLDDGGVPIEVVDESFCRDLFDDPEARRLNLVSETWSSSVGRFEDPGLLVNNAPAEAVVQRGPCACGEQSREILLELGYSDTDIDAMAESRSILDGAS
jgi:crotonobetainyl-CoA:carnitine CoA-transferase CaiB-like acyl-CoA transferase